MNKNMTKFLLLVIILLVTLGVASATDNTTTHTKDTSVALEKTTPTVEKIMTKTETTQKETNKTINKKENKNSIKKESQTIILNSNNFDEYVTLRKFNEKVNDGDTIDIQGKLDSPKFALNVNKPVNIISSTGDAYIDLDTLSTDSNGGYKNGIFQLTSGSNGTNITGLTFHNTRVNISCTSNIHVDNISVICEQPTGFGVGSFSVRDQSENITIANSYFFTIGNSGHSNVVIAGASNSLIENNTIIGDGTKLLIGNLLYLTTYGGGSNSNITIRNNTIRSYNADNYATCYGLCLQGTGHIIEGNIIDNAFPVMAQYADAEYGVETNIDGIIFNNNTIVRGTPQLVFPGIVSNNTFYEGATLKQVYAYNNNFNTVTIQNNVIFENNTANFITVSSDNNILNNNEIYSYEDYAINVTGENNTISNNKLYCKSENAINNDTEIVMSDNEEYILGQVRYITDETLLDYNPTIKESGGITTYTIKNAPFNDNDILVFNITDSKTKVTISSVADKSIHLTVENSTVYQQITLKILCNITLKNSFFFANPMNGNIVPTYLTNSIIEYQTKQTKYVSDENSDVLSVNYPKDNTYVLTPYTIIFDKTKGNILDTVNESATIKFWNYDTRYTAFMSSTINNYLENIIIDKTLNFVPFYTNGNNIASNINFTAGSAGTNITGANLTGIITFETGYINFFNCTFNNDLVIDNTDIVFKGCVFNGKVTLNSSNNAVFNNCSFNSTDAINVENTRNLVFENNTVTTSAVNTIVFDDNYNNNVVRNNYLVAASLVGDDSVVTYDNIVEDNTPSYDTKIVIDCDSQAYVDDNLEVTITVNDLNNSKPVSKGYVEIYYNGYLIDIKDLTDGTTSVTIPVAEYIDDSDNYLKVWYYDGKRYNNNVTKKSISVVKSNVSIAVDEFNAKLNDKVKVTATFLNERGNPVLDTNVTFTVGRSRYTILTENGVATINELVTSEWLDAGKITVTFPSTDAYNSNSTTITLNTSKADITPTINFEQNDDKVTINIGLVDSLNNNITDGKITITTLDGTQLDSTRIRNGTYNATVTLPENYGDNLIVNYTGSYYYNDFTQELEIPYNRVNTITTLTLPETAIIKAPLEILATVTDTDGNKVTIGKVIFTIGDEIIAEVDVTDGTATTTKTFTEVETLTIKATYQKNRDYNTSSSEATITIQKPTSHTNTSTENVTLRETTNITAQFYDENDEAITEGKVIFRLNGKTLRDNNGNVLYAEIVDGQATLPNVNITPEWIKPDTTLQAIYVGDNNNEPITTTPTTITVTRPEATITLETPAPATAGQTITLKATVTDGENNINTGRVAFKLNGKTLKNAEGKALYAEVNDGIATITYTIPEKTKAKEYTLTAVFTDTVYDRVEAESKLNVVKA